MGTREKEQEDRESKGPRTGGQGKRGQRVIRTGYIQEDRKLQEKEQEDREQEGRESEVQGTGGQGLGGKGV